MEAISMIDVSLFHDEQTWWNLPFFPSANICNDFVICLRQTNKKYSKSEHNGSLIKCQQDIPCQSETDISVWSEICFSYFIFMPTTTSGITLLGKVLEHSKCKKVWGKRMEAWKNKLLLGIQLLLSRKANQEKAVV